MTVTPPVIRPAATLILARDCPQGIEVLLLQRSHDAKFAQGAHVFPGGALDASDMLVATQGHCAGPDEAGASRALNVESGGLAHWVAAVRECFEESGLLFAYDEAGELLATGAGELARALADSRRKLRAGQMTLAEVCGTHKLRLATDRLHYFSHWIAPPIAARRFDTRFFVAAAPSAQMPSHDDAETIGHLWISPSDALAHHQSGAMTLMFPTVKTLESLAAFRDTASLIAHTRGLAAVSPVMPRAAKARDGMKILIAGDAAYAEVGKIDPEGTGSASCEIVPGIVTQLSATVRRIASPNPHFMRGPGTNTYLLGAGDDIAVIDPGPAMGDHVHALLALAHGRIRWILVTHTHGDHSPAARLLKERTGAELIGMPPPPFDHQDQGFVPDRILRDGERIRVGGCAIRAIHTPGHASNHLCYLHEDERLLFTGDHIMQGSTVVINPPDGNMCEYLSSLRKVQQEDVDWLAPGHGFLMDRAGERIDALLAHRQARENIVLAALDSLRAATEEQLLPVVYADVPKERFAMAARSLAAHLIKLHEEGRAVESDGLWRRTAAD
ncbi:MAG TPA: MBL fold metallo-hydrolase [Noviherbaspirillum sp.]|uniref:MBL fold metallo-hydrolase n=1 Tax=Noviherbaspirillum sp. TaxID=1926288 RepID=UPI002B49BFDC|nr:MBL fold metallo-hydrolase [Noviherbaspirillum sp.]HJV85979.1 MBL fold metallo-hydrolase [Noviherbaspirillum sp.]